MAPEQLALPSSVQVGRGAGGLPVVRVTGRAGSAEVFLHGAHVTAWVPAGEEPVLWMSAHSTFDRGSALRGGVPICFPWFGANASDPAAPSHGFARLAEWELIGASEVGSDVVLTFELSDSKETRASAWPHAFVARYVVTVGASLTLALQVTNRDPFAVTIEEALHTYLRVRDIEAVEIGGLEGTSFLDRLTTPEASPGQAGPVRFTGETDRIYLNTEAAVTVFDRASGRCVNIAKHGSGSTVVWNPWATKAAAMADFGDDEWTGMVCVETCNVRAAAVTLAPGASHTMAVVFTVGRP